MKVSCRVTSSDHAARTMRETKARAPMPNS
jgi:hypothetical protein